MKTSKKKIGIFIILALILVATVFACYKLVPLLVSLKDTEARVAFQNKISNLGIKGWFIILGIQILQIFIALIPGEIVELISGILYGAIGGLFLCLIGILIGSIAIYYTIKLFANKYIEKYKNKLKEYSFLNNPKKINLYLFIIFLIPGLPKDIFIYLVPFLPIKFTSFMIVSSIARIPSILSSTIVGSSLINGNYLLSIIVFVIFAILGILGILFNDKIINIFKKNHDKQLNSKNNIEN